MVEENGERKPLGTPPRSDEVGNSGKKKLPISASPVKKSPKRRCLTWCSVLTVGIIVTVTVAVILVILAFTVYKVRGPEMRLNSIRIPDTNIATASPNVTVIVDVSVKNRNPVNYYFDESTTTFYYKNVSIGVSSGPSGKAPAHQTYRMNVTVGVPKGGLLTTLVGGGAPVGNPVEINSATMVKGHVKILGLIRHHVDVGMNCTVKVAVLNLTILDQTCWQRVWI